MNKSSSRKWKITKAVFIVSNILGLTILILAYTAGAESFLRAITPVLAYLGTVNSLTAVAYNAANAASKIYDNSSR